MMCRPNPASRAPVFFIEQRSACDAAYVAFFANDGLEAVSVDLDPIVELLALDGLGTSGRGSSFRRQENGSWLKAASLATLLSRPTTIRRFNACPPTQETEPLT
jgi:hypothetical protein